MSGTKGRAGRPRKDPAQRRKHFSTTVPPETWQGIEKYKRPGESAGDVVARAIEALKEKEGKI